MKKALKKGHFAHIGNEIKICSQNKCHHHLSNVCENSFRMFHSNWVISDYHSFVWQFEFPWLNLTNCPNKWMVIRNDPVTVKHTKWIFTDVGKVMIYFGYRFWFHCLYEQNGLLFLKRFSRQWRFWNMISIFVVLYDILHYCNLPYEPGMKTDFKKAEEIFCVGLKQTLFKNIINVFAILIIYFSFQLANPLCFHKRMAVTIFGLTHQY